MACAEATAGPRASAYAAISAGTPSMATSSTIRSRVHDQLGVDRRAPELVVLAHRRQLLRRAVQLDVAPGVAAGLQQDDVEALDAAVQLQAAVVANRLVEHLEAALLASADRSIPADEQHSIGHADSPSLAVPPRGRTCRANLRTRRERYICRMAYPRRRGGQTLGPGAVDPSAMRAPSRRSARSARATRDQPRAREPCVRGGVARPRLPQASATTNACKTSSATATSASDTDSSGW